MSSYELALLLHLLAGIAFFCGVLLARIGALLVGGGAALVLVSGLWLIEERGHSLGDGWLASSVVLLAAGAALGTRSRARTDVAALATGGMILVLMVWRPG